ncbi:HAD family hydrolase [Ruegeria sp.]|uniref:HAD family hydrolase n=1 Tax=Ruegeria sp. TaxID=1879320 RepID=UPI00231F0A84|nr:HAD family hydrolase [Ruegeria sp.]MDA7966821.1 HAD family hydrolase [Ruegeria sp.]
MYCFDFDGVIAESHAICLAACEHACRVQGGQLGDADPFAALDPLTFEAVALECGLEPARFARDVSDFVVNHEQVSPLIPGMSGILRTLAESGPLAIISATHSSVLRRFLDEHDLSDCFDHVIGGDAGKPKAEILVQLDTMTGNRPVVMVGDAVSDIHAAKAINIPCIAVTWGWQPIKMLTEADRIITDPSELLSAIPELKAA